MPDVLDTPAAVEPAQTPPTPATPSPETPPPATPAAPATPSVPPWEADLDKLGAEPVKSPEPAAKPTPEAKPAKPDAPKTAPQPEAKTEPDQIPAFQTNKDLRKWASERHKAALQLERDLSGLRTELDGLKKLQPQTQSDATRLAEQIARQQETIGQYEQVLAVHAFENSPKYAQEFRQPYVEALNKAYEDISELVVNVPTGEKDENDEPVMRQRAATKQDFDYIYRLPRAQARQAAKQMFGDDADEVMDHRRKVNELADRAIKAVEAHKTNYKKVIEEEQGKQAQSRQAMSALWSKANEQISADPRFSHLWGEDKEDPDFNTALAKGFQMADMFFSDERDKMKPADRVVFDANIRHRVAAFSGLAHRVTKLKSALDAANATIAELKGSKPGAPTPSGGAPAKPAITDSIAGIDTLPE